MRLPRNINFGGDLAYGRQLTIAEAAAVRRNIRLQDLDGNALVTLEAVTGALGYTPADEAKSVMTVPTSAVRLSLSDEDSISYVVVDADTGKAWKRKTTDLTGSSGAWNAADWILTGITQVAWGDVSGKPDIAAAIAAAVTAHEGGVGSHAPTAVTGLPDALTDLGYLSANALRFDDLPQVLDEEQQATVLGRIGAKAFVTAIVDARIDDATGAVTTNAVRFTAQSLNYEQKAQARTNIDAQKTLGPNNMLHMAYVNGLGYALSDAKSRTQHTGFQNIATITGLQTALDGLTASINTLNSNAILRTAQPLTPDEQAIQREKIGLGNVSNTADSVKPVSNEQRATINAAVTAHAAGEGVHQMSAIVGLSAALGSITTAITALQGAGGVGGGTTVTADSIGAVSFTTNQTARLATEKAQARLNIGLENIVNPDSPLTPVGIDAVEEAIGAAITAHGQGVEVHDIAAVKDLQDALNARLKLDGTSTIPDTNTQKSIRKSLGILDLVTTEDNATAIAGETRPLLLKNSSDKVKLWPGGNGSVEDLIDLTPDPQDLTGRVKYEENTGYTTGNNVPIDSNNARLMLLGSGNKKVAFVEKNSQIPRFLVQSTDQAANTMTLVGKTMATLDTTPVSAIARVVSAGPGMPDQLWLRYGEGEGDFVRIPAFTSTVSPAPDTIQLDQGFTETIEIGLVGESASYRVFDGSPDTFRSSGRIASDYYILYPGAYQIDATFSALDHDEDMGEATNTPAYPNGSANVALLSLCLSNPGAIGIPTGWTGGVYDTAGQGTFQSIVTLGADPAWKKISLEPKTLAFVDGTKQAYAPNQARAYVEINSADPVMMQIQGGLPCVGASATLVLNITKLSV